MSKEVKLLQYMDAEYLLRFIKKVITKKNDYYVNYQVNLDKMDDIYLHKLMFDYKILSFCETVEENFVVIKLPELEESENAISLWIMKFIDSELLKKTIEKIKEDYSFYGWKYLKIVALRKQLSKEFIEFIKEYAKVQPTILSGNSNENDQFLYYIKLI